jgi:hypothetical protein
VTPPEREDAPAARDAARPGARPDARPDDRPDDERRRERVVEGALLGLLLVVALVIGAPEVLDSLRDRSVDLGAVFYPVIVVAAAALAWTRRARS